MNPEYDVDYDIARKSADLAERIAEFSPDRSTLAELQTLLDEAEEIVGQSKPGRPRERWTCWLAAARCFIATNVLSDAVRSGTGVADAKARLDVLQAEFENATDSSVNERLSEDERPDLAGRIATFLSRPLPVLYWCLDRRWERYRNVPVLDYSSDDKEPDEPLPTIARLIVHIDDSPLVSPQEVRPAALYRVQLEAHLANWPQRVTTLTFRFTTTLASTQYSLSDFNTTKLDEPGEENHIVRATGTLAFPFAQNDPFLPVVFAVSAFLLIGTERHPIRVVGHDQLHVS
jgi:hypothetical protein